MRITFLSCGAFAALLSTSAFAQPTFAPQVPYGTVVGATDIEAGDLDGDGDLDLVVGGDDVSVLLGDGDGTFGAVTNFTASDAFELALGDINNDGDLDVVTAIVGFPGSLGVKLGNGNGTFAAETLFAGGSVPNCVVLGDFDEDGFLDAAVGNSNMDGVDVFIGNGNGTFDAAVTFDPGSGPVDVRTADVDGDGHLDLLTAEAGADINVLLGNGNGGFAAASAFPTGLSDSFDLAIADFDRDGFLDVAVSDGNAGELAVLLGDGAGNFGAGTVFTAGSSPAHVRAADIDGDTMIDLVASDDTNDEIVVLAGNGDGTFDPPLSFSAGLDTSSVVTGDFDADGDLDAAAVNHDSEDVSVFINLRSASRVGINGAPCAFLTIADALAVAVAGDAIHASPGIYDEGVLAMSNFVVTIASSDAVCNAITSRQATIRSNGAGRIFDLDNTDLTLIGLEVQQANAIGHGGIAYADNGSVLVLDDTRFSEGTATINGGCIYTIASDLSLISGAEIEGCTAEGYGGGAYVTTGNFVMQTSAGIRGNIATTGAGGGLALGAATATIRGEISGNSAVAAGGVYVNMNNGVGSNVTVTGNARIVENSADTGGGIYTFGASALTVSADALVGNNTADIGGGIYATDTTFTIQDRVTLENNEAWIDGGAIHATESVLTIAGASLGAIKIRGNAATEEGGGLFLNDCTLTASMLTISGNTADGGAGAWAENTTTGSFSNTRFLNNIAGDGGGGGLYLTGEGTSLIVRSDFATCAPAGLQSQRFCSEVRFNETTGTGGGIKVIGEAALEVNTTSFVGNSSPLNGAGIMVYTNLGGGTLAIVRNSLFLDHLDAQAPAVACTNATMDVYSSTFSNNTFPVFYLPAGGAGLFHRNIVWGNTNDSIMNGNSGNCNTTQTAAGSPAGANNNQLNPLFDAGNARSPFKLQAASPAVDACASGPLNDLDGVARPVNMIWDKGAFER